VRDNDPRDADDLAEPGDGGAGNSISPRHERPEDVARAAAEGEDWPDPSDAIEAATQRVELAQDAEADAADMQADFEALYAEVEQARLPVPSVPWNFVPATIGDVTFLVAAVQQIRAGIAHRTAQVAEMNAVAERLAEALEGRYLSGDGPVAAIVRGELAGGKAKSLKLVTGVSDTPTVAGFRRVPGGLRIVDKDAALTWAEGETADAQGRLVRRRVVETVAPVAAEFAAYHKSTGEVPGGCEVVEPRETFYLR